MVRTWLYSILGIVGFLVAVYLLLTYALPLVLPFAVAIIVAELMEPIISRLTWRGKVPRTLVVAVVMLIFVGLITTAVTVGIARLVEEIQTIYASLPVLLAMGMDAGNRIAEQFGAFHASLPESIQEMVTKNLNGLYESLQRRIGPNAQSTLGYFSSLPAFLTNLLVALIATFFISRDRRQIFDFLLSLFPAVWRPKIRQVKIDVWSSAMGFAKAQLTLILLTMIQSIIGLTLIGSNYPVVMGVVVGTADLMPVLGPSAIYLPWIAYSFLFGSKVFGIKLLILYGAVTAIRQVLEAKLVGDQIGLHPLAILLSIYLGFHFFGPLGFVVGPLLAILLKAMIHSGLLPSLQDPPTTKR